MPEVRRKDGSLHSIHSVDDLTKFDSEVAFFGSLGLDPAEHSIEEDRAHQLHQTDPGKPPTIVDTFHTPEAATEARNSRMAEILGSTPGANRYLQREGREFHVVMRAEPSDDDAGDVDQEDDTPTEPPIHPAQAIPEHDDRGEIEGRNR